MRRWWHLTVVASVCLISIIANIEAGYLRSSLLVVKAERCVFRLSECPVHKTPLKNDNFIPFEHRIGDKVGGCLNRVIIGASPDATRRWENDTSALPIGRVPAGTQVLLDGLIRNLITCDDHANRFSVGMETNPRFMSAIFISKDDFNGLPDSQFRCNRRGSRPYPRPLRLDQCPLRTFRLLNRGFGAHFGRVRLILDRSVCLDHFADLPPDGNHSESEQNDGKPFPKPLSAILALIFISSGAALCRYGVDQSREIGGWAVWFIVGGGICFAFSSYVFFSGVLGWALI